MNRRSFLQVGSTATAVGLLTHAQRAEAQTHEGHEAPAAPEAAPAPAPAPASRAAIARPYPAGQPGVTVPNGETLPWRVVDGVKVGQNHHAGE